MNELFSFQWKKFSDQKPIPETLLVAFLLKRKRYIIGRYCIEEFEGETSEFWVAHTGTIFDLGPEDFWNYIPPIKIEEVYD